MPLSLFQKLISGALMRQYRWNIIPIAFVTTGVAVAVLSTLLSGRPFDAYQLGVYAGGLIALVSVYWLKHQPTQAEAVLEEQKNALLEAREQLRIQADILEAREEKLSRKLIAFQEWTEYPQPIDLTSPHHSEQMHTQELWKKDRQVLQLLEQESRRVYEKIASNGYSVEGKFKPELLRDDVYSLVREVARIYNPQSENPILETSAENLLRAGGRACLHLLVVLERLPLNVKEYDIAAIYRYVRTGIKAVGVYKVAQPWLNYAKNAGYVGRFFLGASPMSLAAWWLLSEVGTRGARKLVNHVVDYQAVALMHDIVRVIGYEVASIYGGDFRHRDPNWIYGCELTEMLARFPTSRDGLRQAMKEIGALMLRNEYDRIHLYRCVAAHQSAHPQRFMAEQLLDDHERQQIAKRLEDFFKQYIHARSEETISKWRQEVEERLHVRLQLGSSTGIVGRDDTENAVRSLAAFLLSQKEKEPHDLPASLSASHLFSGMEDHRRAALLEHLQAEPNYLFDAPDLDSTSPIVDQYLNDLALLAARTPPYTDDADETVSEAARFYRRDASQVQSLLKKAYREELIRRFSTPPNTRKVPLPLARQILQTLVENETPSLLYSDVVLEMPDRSEPPDFGDLWLLGTSHRLVLFGTKPRPEILWKGHRDQVQPVKVEGYLINDCRLVGGEWLLERQPVSMRIPGSMTSRYHTYFQPLLQYFSNPSASISAPTDR